MSECFACPKCSCALSCWHLHCQTFAFYRICMSSDWYLLIGLTFKWSLWIYSMITTHLFSDRQLYNYKTMYRTCTLYNATIIIVINRHKHTQSHSPLTLSFGWQFYNPIKWFCLFLTFQLPSSFFIENPKTTPSSADKITCSVLKNKMIIPCWHCYQRPNKITKKLVLKLHFIHFLTSTTASVQNIKHIDIVYQSEFLLFVSVAWLSLTCFTGLYFITFFLASYSSPSSLSMWFMHEKKRRNALRIVREMKDGNCVSRKCLRLLWHFWP